MKNCIKIAAAAAAALVLCTDASAFTLKKKIGDVDTKLKIYGFAQLDARGGDGSFTKNSTEQDADVKFSAQRIRLGWNYSAGIVRGKVFMDFNQDAEVNAVNGDVGLPKDIKDAFISLRFDKAFSTKFGLIKMPHGMSFTIPGWNLDIVERGFDKQLVLERNMGIMISGRDMFLGNNGKVNGFEMGHERAWKGFGYDLMIANQAGRSKAVKNVKPGDANSYAARLMFDYTEKLHTELSYAISESAGGILGHIDDTQTALTVGSEDYKSLNFGIDSHLEETNLKFEYFNSENIKGEKGWDESTMSLTATHYVTDTVELVAKHIMADAERIVAGNTVKTDLSNTYIGFNYFLAAFDNKMDRNSKRKRNSAKISFNYIVASGDTSDVAGPEKFNGLGGYRDDAWVLQAQYKF